MEYLAVVLFATVAIITPGPNNLMVLTSGLNFGLRRSLPHFWGICLGFPVMLLAVGLGAGALFAHFSGLYLLLKALACAYLLYLAWRIATMAPPAEVTAQGRPITFLQAALFQWVNPKAWMISLGAVAAYTSLDRDAVSQSLQLALIFLLVGIPCVGAWLLMGHGARRFLTAPHLLRLFNIGMALLLVLSLLPVLGELGALVISRADLPG